MKQPTESFEIVSSTHLIVMYNIFVHFCANLKNLSGRVGREGYVDLSVAMNFETCCTFSTQIVCFVFESSVKF